MAQKQPNPTSTGGRPAPPPMPPLLLRHDSAAFMHCCECGQPLLHGQSVMVRIGSSVGKSEKFLSSARHAECVRPDWLVETEGTTANRQLEQALRHAGQANDIESLKALARQESNRADQVTQLLIAVLKANGSALVSRGVMTADRNTGGYVLTEVEGRRWLVSAAP